MSDGEEDRSGSFVLVTRKGGYGLPTACPSCLSVYLYLRFANTAFNLLYDVSNPDSDHVPYFEYGYYVAFNNEKGGVIEALKQEGIADLDPKASSSYFSEWLSTKALMSSWLSAAIEYELWVASDSNIAHKIYFSDLPWLLAKVLHKKQSRAVKRLLGITNLTASEREEEIYRNATLAFKALSLRLGDQSFFFEDRPTSVDALFFGYALFVLHVLPDTSALKVDFLKHDNLVNYAENLKKQFLDGDPSAAAFVPRSRSDASTSNTRRKGSHWSSKPNPKPKREKTEEEKTFRRRAKYFLGAQFVAVLVFLSLFGGADGPQLQNDDGDEFAYED
ncbi:mitochondrial outer membrane import complex protein METAXIN [Phalaenopsis equestris]|uniref:mitochondrial outer membrane import complex protein METAXIN n=1 Tax=Phalaenopsis equestris TaxID=78828 RepID=UPI0009E41001|nr:mitochondrial outer membrane import complex protein METAXIN [Phalaenopsis equestris]